MFDESKWLTYDQLREKLGFSHGFLRSALEQLGIQSHQCDPADLKIRRYPVECIEDLRTYAKKQMGQA